MVHLKTKAIYVQSENEVVKKKLERIEARLKQVQSRQTQVESQSEQIKRQREVQAMISEKKIKTLEETISDQKDEKEEFVVKLEKEARKM